MSIRFANYEKRRRRRRRRKRRGRKAETRRRKEKVEEGEQVKGAAQELGATPSFPHFLEEDH